MAPLASKVLPMHSKLKSLSDEWEKLSGAERRLIGNFAAFDQPDPIGPALMEAVGYLDDFLAFYRKPQGNSGRTRSRSQAWLQPLEEFAYILVAFWNASQVQPFLPKLDSMEDLVDEGEVPWEPIGKSMQFFDDCCIALEVITGVEYELKSRFTAANRAATALRTRGKTKDKQK